MTDTLKKIWNLLNGFVLLGLIGFGIYHEFQGNYPAASCNYLFVIAIVVLDNFTDKKLQ